SLMGHLGAYSKTEATIDGTYNASPYALAAANKTLEIMASDDIFTTLYARGEQMRAGIADAIAETGAPATVTGLGSEWAIYFRPELPKNFRESLECDAEMYGRYHAS